MRKEKMADGPGTGFTFVSTRLAKGKSSRGNQYLFDFLLLPTNTQPPFGTNGEMVLYLFGERYRFGT